MTEQQYPHMRKTDDYKVYIRKNLNEGWSHLIYINYKQRSVDFDKCLLVLMIRDYENSDDVWDS